MNPSAIDKLRHKLRCGLPVYGIWITLESPTVSEMAVGLGLDWIVIDAEHGHLDWSEIVAHLRSTVRSDTVVLVRIAELNESLIKRALDLGADGIVIPSVNDASQLSRAIAAANYPLEGVRGIGAERATGWGSCFTRHATDCFGRVLVVPMIESVQAAENIEAIVAVDGCELFFFGPADFSATAGAAGQWETEDVRQQILRCKTVIRHAGKACGVVATNSQNLIERRQQGFQMLGLGLDAGLLLRSMTETLGSAGVFRKLTPELIPLNLATTEHPLERPPENFRPLRRESIQGVTEGPSLQLDAGVVLRIQVGDSTGANRLTTGIVTFAPAAKLAYHRHTCGETITVLDGTLVVEVAGRSYRLQTLDNITIPAGLPHMAENSDPQTPVRAHVALASAAPDRELVEPPLTVYTIPGDSCGHVGAEHVVRHATAPRYAAGPGTEFVDYLNAEMIPGIEMSGGWGVFKKGGRLPAHLHDFDESICIIQGVASCIVEGEYNALSDCDTAHVPRGRIHYFINESDQAMQMIWVYAGPLPQRLVVRESCATVDGNPWRERKLQEALG